MRALHELGIVCQAVDTVIEFARKNNVTKVDKLVLQIGELSPVIPRYVRACFPSAVEGTILEGARLVIETVPGRAKCPGCGKVYPVRRHGRVCPKCGGTEGAVVEGEDFVIKEIVAR